MDFEFSTIISYNFEKELIYHSVAAILILIASIVLIVVINDNRYWHDVYKPLMAATVSQ